MVPILSNVNSQIVVAALPGLKYFSLPWYYILSLKLVKTEQVYVIFLLSSFRAWSIKRRSYWEDEKTNSSYSMTAAITSLYFYGIIRNTNSRVLSSVNILSR
jgi:hypothetical protein